ncbi:DMT family transporter [Paenibacillus albicereus]|uniref:DMT family transporter n=1 Tax=Paenibacillus albicereus TaxID=2726185 RepID=A0A6H2GY58_9BACL|nr:DMT family transporter [Paenibacillus albicereus]QJC52350.1 DMT family transporter [Paenibacillus albicereus]
MDSSSRAGMLLLLASFSMAGSSVIAAALLGGHLQPFTLTAASLLLSLLCLLPFLGRGSVASLRRLSRAQWLQLAGQALFGVVLFRVCLQLGLERTSSAEAGVMIGGTPALTVGIAWLLLRERSGPARLAGVLATVLGVMLIQGAAGGAPLSQAHLAGNLLVLAAAANEALFSVLSRWTAAGKAGGRKAGGSAERSGMEAGGSGAAGEPSGAAAQPADGAEAPLRPALQTTLVAGMALLLSLPLAAFERPLGALAALGATEWAALVWYGPVVTAAAFGLWYAGIKRCPASTAAACSGMMPFSALLLSVLVLGEHAGWTQWSGGLLVMLGMALIGRASGRAGRRPREAAPLAGGEKLRA